MVAARTSRTAACSSVRTVLAAWVGSLPCSSSRAGPSSGVILTYQKLLPMEAAAVRQVAFRHCTVRGESRSRFRDCGATQLGMALGLRRLWVSMLIRLRMYDCNCEETKRHGLRTVERHYLFPPILVLSALLPIATPPCRDGMRGLAPASDHPHGVSHLTEVNCVTRVRK